MIPDGITTEVERHDDSDDSTMVAAAIHPPGGQSWSASAFVNGNPTDDELADLIVKVAVGVAGLYGGGVWMAVQRRLAMESER